MSNKTSGTYILGISTGFLLVVALLVLGINTFITVGKEITYLKEGDRDNCVKTILNNMDPVVLYLSISFICISVFINLIVFGWLVSECYQIYKLNNNGWDGISTNQPRMTIGDSLTKVGNRQGIRIPTAAPKPEPWSEQERVRQIMNLSDSDWKKLEKAKLLGDPTGEWVQYIKKSPLSGNETVWDKKSGKTDKWIDHMI